MPNIFNWNSIEIHKKNFSPMHLKSKLNWVNWVTVLMVPSDLGTLSQDVGGKVGEISWRWGENDIVIHVVQGIVVTRSQVWSVIIAWWLQIIQKKRRNKWLYVQFMYQSQMSMESSRCRVEELTKKLWKKRICHARQLGNISWYGLGKVGKFRLDGIKSSHASTHFHPCS